VSVDDIGGSRKTRFILLRCFNPMCDTDTFTDSTLPSPLTKPVDIIKAPAEIEMIEGFFADNFSMQ